MKKQNVRGRNFATVVYPESAPENWKETLAKHYVPAFISPLHKDDENPDGTKKKEHYHVMIMFDGLKTTQQAQEIFDTIEGVGLESVKSIRGYARYLCHLDNPEKAQYDPEKVRCLGGADYHETCKCFANKYAVISEVRAFCEENNVVSLAELINYCDSERPEWFRVLVDNTIFIKEYLKSRQWTSEQRR